MDVRLLLCCCSYQSLALLLLQREPSRVRTGPGRCSGEDAGTFRVPTWAEGQGPWKEPVWLPASRPVPSDQLRAGWVVDMVHARMSSFSWLLLFHFLLYKWTVEDYSL